MSIEPKFKKMSRAAWQNLHNKKKIVTASQVGTILGQNKYETPFELWAKKTGRVPGFEGNVATRVGHHMEDAIAGEYQFANPEAKIENPGGTTVVVHPEIPWLVSTLDRWLPERPAPLELKNSLSFDKSPWHDDKGPLVYQLQLQAQMACTGADEGVLAALLGYEYVEHEHQFRADLFNDVILPKIEEFIKMCVDDVAPDRDYTKESTMEVLKVLHPDDNGETVMIGERGDELVQSYWVAGAQEKVAKKIKDIIKTEIFDLLGDNTFGQTEEGLKVTYKMGKESEVKAYTRKASRKMTFPRKPKGE